MKTIHLLTAVAIVAVGGLANSARIHAAGCATQESGAAQISRIAGPQFVPQAALYLTGEMTRDTWTLSFAHAPAGSGAAQIIRVAGSQYVPQAALYLTGEMAQDTWTLALAASKSHSTCQD